MSEIVKNVVDGLAVLINKIDKRELLWFLAICGLVGTGGFGYLIYAHQLLINQYTYWAVILSFALMSASLFVLNLHQRQELLIKKADKNHILNIKHFWDSIESFPTRLKLRMAAEYGYGISLDSDPKIKTIMERNVYGKYKQIRNKFDFTELLFFISDENLISTIMAGREMEDAAQLDSIMKLVINTESVQTEEALMNVSIQILTASGGDSEKILKSIDNLDTEEKNRMNYYLRY